MTNNEAYELGYRQGNRQHVDASEMKAYYEATESDKSWRLERAFNEGWNDALDEEIGRSALAAYLD